MILFQSLDGGAYCWSRDSDRREGASHNKPGEIRISVGEFSNSLSSSPSPHGEKYKYLPSYPRFPLLPSFHPSILLSKHLSIKTSSHQTILPSNHLFIKPSFHRNILLSYHLSILSSFHQNTLPSKHLSHNIFPSYQVFPTLGHHSPSSPFNTWKTFIHLGLQTYLSLWHIVTHLNCDDFEAKYVDSVMLLFDIHHWHTS